MVLCSRDARETPEDAVEDFCFSCPGQSALVSDRGLAAASWCSDFRRGWFAGACITQRRSGGDASSSSKPDGDPTSSAKYPSVPRKRRLSPMKNVEPTVLEYAAYFGSIEHDLQNGTLHGSVQGLRDVVTYEAETLPALRKAFQSSVDDYLNFCKADGVDPDRPYSGKFNARLSPETHRRAASIAGLRGLSLNDLVVRALENEMANYRED